MKKLTILICVLAILLAFTGVAFAGDGPESEIFTITGYTTSYEFETLPSGLTEFYLTAAGTVSGKFNGTFTYDEWGIVDLDPITWEGSGRGINVGIMTITTDKGKVVIGFGGQADYFAQAVWGYFRVRDGTDAYKHLRGWGGYTGTMGVPFTVEFEGRFYEARR